MSSRALTAFRAGSAVARALPAPVVRGLASGGGVLMGRFDATRRGQVERNLRRVLGPELEGPALRRAVAHTFASYAHYWAEAFRLPGTSIDELLAGLTHEGYDLILEALEEGKGAIMALPHLGAWEWAGFWAAVAKGHPVSVVVEALEPPEVFEWFAELRRSLGMQIIPLGPDAGSTVVRALKANHIVCLLSDRDIGGGGVEVAFFGERTRLPAGPATLALRTGAPILPIGVYFRGSSHHAIVRPRLAVAREGKLRDDVVRITQALAHELEWLIRQAPEQWHLMQPNWPSDPGYDATAPVR